MLVSLFGVDSTLEKYLILSDVAVNYSHYCHFQTFYHSWTLASFSLYQALLQAGLLHLTVLHKLIKLWGYT